MPQSVATVFTEDEIKVLLDILGFATDEFDEDNALVESAKEKIWNEELFSEDEVRVIRRAMYYADDHMHRRHNILAAQRLNEHWTAIDMKLDSMPED